jgi:NADH-quinone oxidoreductase subunit I
MKLSNKTKVIEQGEMTLAERMYLPAIVGGMATTLKHFFSKPVTIRYPEQTRYLGPIYRGQHILKRDEQGAERCTA